MVKIMKIEVKKLYEKMIDFHRFASVLMAVAVFFYLGTFIPNESNNHLNQYVGLGGALIFIGGSVFFFIQSKSLRKRLEESDEGQEYLMKK